MFCVVIGVCDGLNLPFLFVFVCVCMCVRARAHVYIYIYIDILCVFVFARDLGTLTGGGSRKNINVEITLKNGIRVLKQTVEVFQTLYSQNAIFQKCLFSAAWSECLNLNNVFHVCSLSSEIVV